MKKFLALPYKKLARDAAELQIKLYKEGKTFDEKEDEIVYPLASDLVNYEFLKEEGMGALSEMVKKLHNADEIVVFAEAGEDPLSDVLIAIGIRLDIKVIQAFTDYTVFRISIE